MKITAFCLSFFISMAAMAAPVEIKGKSGNSLKVEVVSVDHNGFKAYEIDPQKVFTVPWDKVDMDWLASNQPEMHAKYEAANKAAQKSYQALADLMAGMFIDPKYGKGQRISYGASNGIGGTLTPTVNYQALLNALNDPVKSYPCKRYLSLLSSATIQKDPLTGEEKERQSGLINSIKENQHVIQGDSFTNEVLNRLDNLKRIMTSVQSDIESSGERESPEERNRRFKKDAVRKELIALDALFKTKFPNVK